jgi:hypothetical protein
MLARTTNLSIVLAGTIRPALCSIQVRVQCNILRSILGLVQGDVFRDVLCLIPRVVPCGILFIFRNYDGHGRGQQRQNADKAGNKFLHDISP